MQLLNRRVKRASGEEGRTKGDSKPAACTALAVARRPGCQTICEAVVSDKGTAGASKTRPQQGRSNARPMRRPGVSRDIDRHRLEHDRPSSGLGGDHALFFSVTGGGLSPRLHTVVFA
jgi:hypothetical protein